MSTATPRALQHAFVVTLTTEPEFVELARLGEARGWDAVLTWEAVYRHDAWATLAAAASVTSTIRLGTLLTPVSRYRPWDLAQRIASVDRLSAGRVLLGVGLGAVNANWLSFEPDEPRAVRARRVDEGLQVYAGLLASATTQEPYAHEGEFWSVGLSPSSRRHHRSSNPTHPSGWWGPSSPVTRGNRRSTGPPGGRGYFRRSPEAPTAAPGSPSTRSTRSSSECAPRVWASACRGRATMSWSRATATAASARSAARRLRGPTPGPPGG